MNAFGATRTSGILLHVSCLPSAYGIGDLGPGARAFATFLHQAGQSCWQILPLNPTASFMGSSPYSSPSVFAGNPLFISPEDMTGQGLAEPGDIRALERPDNGRIDYQDLERARGAFLDRVFERLADRLDDLPGYRAFVDQNLEPWLDGYALYRVLKDRAGGACWCDWDPSLRGRDRESLDEVRRTSARELNRVKFEQYLFFSQLARLRKHLAGLGIRLIGDVPIYPTYDSADVWEHQDIFKLDDDGAQTALAGVPPDYFSETGQLWGNPVYRWDVLEERGFDWWLARLEQGLACADVLRLDHFRGFAACWEVPPEAETAKGGHWVEVPGHAFFTAIKKRFPKMPFIAEDLGLITQDVLDLRDDFGLPGMRVLLFGFGDDIAESTNALHNHESCCVAYCGTHDNNTVRGWFEQEAGEQEKRHLALYLGKEISAQSVAWDLVRLSLSSVARTAILPMQDVLRLGAEARLNTPATADGNWGWRLPNTAPDDKLAANLVKITKLFGRA